MLSALFLVHERERERRELYNLWRVLLIGFETGKGLVFRLLDKRDYVFNDFAHDEQDVEDFVCVHCL